MNNLSEEPISLDPKTLKPKKICLKFQVIVTERDSIKLTEFNLNGFMNVHCYSSNYQEN